MPQELIDLSFSFSSRVNNGKVQITFNQPVVALALTPEQALSFAKVLVVKANLIKKP